MWNLRKWGANKRRISLKMPRRSPHNKRKRSKFEKRGFCRERRPKNEWKRRRIVTKWIVKGSIYMAWWIVLCVSRSICVARRAPRQCATGPPDFLLIHLHLTVNGRYKGDFPLFQFPYNQFSTFLATTDNNIWHIGQQNSAGLQKDKITPWNCF